ncbi:amidase [Pseudomonas citronellolis]|uniref:amidase n=1 Tax=Pseudomonas citronellolis TaxID=53408 RepID=UPI00209DCAD9|nr:amidase [Pseudomonas citronellolis]MCP1641577.1 amidase [Pseudomonas citronellolis]MCP1664495.1 amidase [Pseudomonas citronellolis]MCP1695469.1 amidase [Pseudomonas citronellolis]MCP1702330.1 amidase [Pseudomonas citronellolis]MCP1796216.1 amidase [Pseudomonas citronellolis]
MSQNPNISPLVQLQAHELAQLIRLRQVSCREVMGDYLAHIERFNPAVNALVSLQPAEALLAQADQRDAELARGEYRGWMHGLPHAIKDLSLTKGIRTTLGSPLYRDYVPERDGIMVERIRAAGAILIGKSNTPEFGLGSQSYNPLFGATGCAYDPSRTAGGSSGGAAAALAMQLVPVADGSDMMGSLRNPAAFNNIVGFRPSQGRVPFDDAADLFFDQLGYEGPMGRSVRDVALLLSVQAGADARAPLSIAESGKTFAGPLERDFKGARLGWLGDLGGHLAMERGVLELCQRSFADFQAIGCEVESCELGFSAERLWDCWRTLRHWFVAGSLGAAYADPAKRELLKPEAHWEVENGLRLSAMDVYQATVARSDWYRAIQRLFERYDYLLLPSAQVFPFDKNLHWPKEVAGRAMDTYHRWMEVVIPATLSGCPVANVPVGFNEQGLPMGLQIIGRHQADMAVLQLAHAYEQATQWYRRCPPPLLAQ